MGTQSVGVFSMVRDVARKAFSYLKIAFASFSRLRAAQAAAGIAYYAFFSLFPLLLLLVAGGSYFLSEEQVIAYVLRFVRSVLPISTDFLNRNIDRVLELRGPVGITGIVGLLWSSTGVFTALAHNINLILSEAKQRGYLRRRLVALGMIGVLVVFFLFSIAATTIGEVLPNLQAPSASNDIALGAKVFALLTTLIEWTSVFLMFLAMYRWVPTVIVSWRAALWGAMVAMLLWQIATNAFTWYLQHGFSRYELIYGSLGAVAALLFLIYINAWVALFGAHLCAAIDERDQKSSGEI